MSEEMTENTSVEAQPDEAVEAVESTSTDIDWKREARKWESRAKAAQQDKEAAEKWREYEASLKPLEERRAEELAQAKEQAIAAQQELLRYQIASEKGIPANAIKLLVGNNKEEMESAADELLALISENNKSKSPKPVADQGRPANSGTSTPDQFAAALGELL